MSVSELSRLNKTLIILFGSLVLFIVITMPKDHPQQMNASIEAQNSTMQNASFHE